LEGVERVIMEFKKLFEPVQIGKVQIRNRIAMAPMGVTGLVGPDGILTQRVIDYYSERAYGGVGLIITGLTKAEEKVETKFLLPMVSYVSAYSFGELAEAVHYYESKLFVQLTPGVGRVMPTAYIDRGNNPVAPSAIQAYWKPSMTTKALTIKEVEELVRAMGTAAGMLKDLGIDGVELHGHEGYLLDEFTTSIWNKRKDKYGGDLKERLTFPMEIVNAIKDKAGRDFPVIYRFGLKHYMKDLHSGALKGEDYVEAGRNIKEGLEMAKLLEKAGVDALHVDAGCYESYYWPHPPIYQEYGCMVDMAEMVKNVVKIPVIAVGKLDIPELAEMVLKEGKADIVALGRALLADPHWPKKVRERKIEDIRPCIGCHDGCLGREDQRKPLSCATNPATGRERLYEIVSSSKPRKVLIAGGGIAGMEAARVAAIKGDDVTLFEKSEILGGHLIAASVPDFKQSVKRLLDWYRSQLIGLRVEVKLNTEVTPELVKNERPEKVVVATGSTPIISSIPGIEKRLLNTAIDLLLGKRRAGNTIVMIGGGLIGCETGLWLARQGKRVIIVEMLPEVTMGIYHANSTMLLDMLALNKVEIMTNTTLEEIKEQEVIVIDKSFKKTIIKCDTVALALGLEPRRELYESLMGEFAELYAIGDCKKPGKMLNAIWDGYNIGRS
jgi:2-enoate reductase